MSMMSSDYQPEPVFVEPVTDEEYQTRWIVLMYGEEMCQCRDKEHAEMIAESLYLSHSLAHYIRYIR